MIGTVVQLLFGWLWLRNWWWTMLTQIGAPPEVVARLEEACASAAANRPHGTSCVGEDPALDQFMEAYCEMLTKYEQELSKPFKEAMLFLSRIECQFKALTLSPSDSGDKSLFSLFCFSNILYLNSKSFILLRSYCFHWIIAWFSVLYINDSLHVHVPKKTPFVYYKKECCF